MQCDAVLRELSNYIDGAVSPDLHRKMKDHFQGCESCTTMLESTRSVVQALNDDRMIDRVREDGIDPARREDIRSEHCAGRIFRNLWLGFSAGTIFSRL